MIFRIGKKTLTLGDIFGSYWLSTPAKQLIAQLSKIIHRVLSSQRFGAEHFIDTHTWCDSFPGPLYEVVLLILVGWSWLASPLLLKPTSTTAMSYSELHQPGCFTNARCLTSWLIGWLVDRLLLCPVLIIIFQCHCYVSPSIILI